MTREEAKKIMLKHQFAFASMPYEVIKAVSYLIEEQEPRWIPVSERLPEENKTVIASTEYEVCPETRYTKEDGWEWAYESGVGYWEKLAGVKAWMPLPELYKAESEE